MSREKRLIIHCARTHFCQGRADAVQRIIRRKVDWDYVLECGSSYGIAPLLYHNLRKLPNADAIPQPVMDRLKRFHHAVGLRNMQFYGELHKVVERLQQDGIPVILLKGAVLAKVVYPDAALRLMSDIDLLVKKTHLPAVQEILPELGYRPSSKLSADFYEDHHHLMPYVRHDKSVKVEVHHNIAPEPFMSRISASGLWEEMEPVNIMGFDAFALSPEDLILHLCLHFSDDLFVERMKPLVDISETIRHYGGRLNWRSIIRKSNRSGIGSFVYCSLYLAGEMMDAAIPAYVLRDLDLCPSLHPLEVKLLRTALKRSILRWRLLPFPSWPITSLYKEFLYTPEAHLRLRNALKVVSSWIVSQVLSFGPAEK